MQENCDYSNIITELRNEINTLKAEVIKQDEIITDLKEDVSYGYYWGTNINTYVCTYRI